MGMCRFSPSNKLCGTRGHYSWMREGLLSSTTHCTTFTAVSGSSKGLQQAFSPEPLPFLILYESILLCTYVCDWSVCVDVNVLLGRLGLQWWYRQWEETELTLGSFNLFLFQSKRKSSSFSEPTLISHLQCLTFFFPWGTVASIHFCSPSTALSQIQQICTRGQMLTQSTSLGAG